MADNLDSLSAEEAKAFAANNRRAAAEYLAKAEAVEKKFGIAPAPASAGGEGVEEKANRTDGDAALFDRLAGTGELTKLAAENPERFEQLVEAKRLAGERKLFQGAMP